MDSEISHDGINRRSGAERRNWQCNSDFPYVDSHGILVINDRRAGNERRDVNLAKSEKVQNLIR